MPIYVAECGRCGRTEDYFRTVERHADAPKCSACGTRMHQIITPTWVQPDLPEYISPVSGKLIRGRRMRRYDLESNNCRPYEGLEQELKEARRIRSEQEKKLGKQLDEVIEKTITDLDMSNRLTRTGERSDQPFDSGDARVY